MKSFSNNRRFLVKLRAFNAIADGSPFAHPSLCLSRSAKMNDKKQSGQ